MNESTSKTYSSISSELVRDPDNFQLWQQLIAASESNNKKGINKTTPLEEVEVLRSTYSRFLDKYPRLFKYWIKLATWEFRLGNAERAEATYQSSLIHLSYCIEIWISYLKFKINTTHDHSKILELFELARKKIGYHFHSYEFYDLYLSFLESYQSDETNNYKLRYHVLLRIIVEIPLYHYEYFFKKLFGIIAALGANNDTKGLSLLVPTKELSHIKGAKNASVQLKKLFIDVYITTQHKVYELFQFEKKLTKQYFDTNFISQQQLDAWFMYLDYLQVREYSYDYMIFSYERCLLATALYPKGWIKYANFHISRGDIGSAIEVLERGYSSNGQYQLLIKLADCHVHARSYIKARDLIVCFISNNVSVPIPIYEKLINIERLINPDDDQYLVNVIKELIRETNQDWWFNHILYYDIELEKKIQVFTEFEDFYKNSSIFQKSLQKLRFYNNKKEHNKPNEIYKEYDYEINKYI